MEDKEMTKATTDLGNCPDCDKPLKPPYYIIYPLVEQLPEIEDCITAVCTSREGEIKNELKFAELVKVKTQAIDREHFTRWFMKCKKRRCKKCMAKNGRKGGGEKEEQINNYSQKIFSDFLNMTEQHLKQYKNNKEGR